jgi:hypothetical protein
MSFRHIGFLTILAVAIAAPLGAQVPTPISIQQCFVTVPRHFSNKATGTQIMYTNTSRRTATRVTFAVAYRNAENHFLRNVTDVGTFDPGATMDHHFALFSDVTFAGKAATCRVISVRFQDGSTWVRR